MKNDKYLITLAALLCIPVWVFSQTEPKQFVAELPLIDIPANPEHSFLSVKQDNPSFQQSLALTKIITQTEQHYLERLWFKPNAHYTPKQKILRNTGYYISDGLIQLAVMSRIPLGGAWLHEEWHRSVLNKENIRSKNGINQFEFFSDKVSVTGITDHALEQLKRDKPHDFTRLAVAGIEAQYEHNHSLQYDHFFSNLSTKSEMSYWVNFLSAALYVQSSATVKDDEITQIENKEGSNPLNRDFIGLDFTAWVYDLHRPNEPYRNRGLHPSGEGVKRYIKPSDLSDEEKKYLTQMGRLQWLNVLNPFMFGVNHFRVGEHKMNANVFHYLTSFGYDIGARFYLQTSKNQWYVALHNYHTKNNNYWGAEVSRVNMPVFPKQWGVVMTPTVHVWSQPRSLTFNDHQSDIGGRAEVMISGNDQHKLSPYCSLSYKTKGWVAGNVYQNENMSFRAGLKMRL